MVENGTENPGYLTISTDKIGMIYLKLIQWQKKLEHQNINQE